MTNGTEPELLTFSQMNVIGIISLLTSALSLMGSGSILVCAIYHRRACYPEIFPIFHLSVADCLASVFMMFISILFLDGFPSNPGATGPCGYLVAIMTSMYICTFFLTLMYALEAFTRLRRRLQAYLSLEGIRSTGASNYCMYVMYFLSWLVPISLGVFLMLVTHYIRDDDDAWERIMPTECSLCFPVFSAHHTYCWTQVEDGRQWLLMYRLIFLVPLVLFFLLNTVLYVCIARDFKQVSMRRGLLSYHQQQEESMLRKKAVLYQSAFIVCWIPTLILQLSSFLPSYSMSSVYSLFILQALLGPLQGLLNCIIYGWKRQSFRRALSESSSLLSTSRNTSSFTL